jgi:hypothetical protein
MKDEGLTDYRCMYVKYLLLSLRAKRSNFGVSDINRLVIASS